MVTEDLIYLSINRYLEERERAMVNDIEMSKLT